MKNLNYALLVILELLTMPSSLRSECDSIAVNFYLPLIFNINSEFSFWGWCVKILNLGRGVSLGVYSAAQTWWPWSYSSFVCSVFRRVIKLASEYDRQDSRRGRDLGL